MTKIYQSLYFFITTILLTSILSGCKDNDNPDKPDKPVVLQSIEVLPYMTNTEDTVSIELPVGLLQTYKALGVYSDGSTEDMSHQVSWKTSDSDIASITFNDAAGYATATSLSSGTVEITANFELNPMDSTPPSLVVNTSMISDFYISPYTATTVVGFSQHYTVQGIFSDGSTHDLSLHPAVIWESNDEYIATIHKTSGVATGNSPGEVGISASIMVNGAYAHDTAHLTVSDAEVVGHDITPEIGSMVKGSTMQYIATARLSDGTILDVTHDPLLLWESDNINIASIDPDTGIVTSHNVGETKITAAIHFNNEVYTEKTTLTVFSTSSVLTWGESLTGGDVNDTTQNLLVDVTSITSGKHAFAALKKDGSVVTWGQADEGGNSDDMQHKLVNVTSIAATASAFAAIKKNGSVVTWGQSDEGGYSDDVQHELVNVTSITGTSSAFAAIKKDGSVVTWGQSNEGGDSSQLQYELTNVQTISSTNKAFSAIKADGTVISWGEAEFGGNSHTLPYELVDVLSITATGFAFSALKRDGTVITWGLDSAGGDSSHVQYELDKVKSITATDFAFAALKQDGSVVTWGHNSEGGNSDAVQAELNNVIAISATDTAFTATKHDGSTTTWGNTFDAGYSSQALINVSSISSNDSSFAAIILK